MHAVLLLVLVSADPSPEPTTKKETREQLMKRFVGLLKAALAKKLPPKKLVEFLFQETLGRAPKAKELDIATAYLKKKSGAEGVEGLAWSLINTKEFLTRHGMKLPEGLRFVQEVSAAWRK
jgi:hypothetical protein